MNVNVIVEFLKAFFYKTFEILPVIGNSLNYLYIVILFVLFVYWLSVLAKNQKNERQYR
jgi:hypothetical protein